MSIPKIGSDAVASVIPVNSVSCCSHGPGRFFCLVVAGLFFLLLKGLVPPAFAVEDRDWFMSVYGGQISDNNLSEVAYSPKFANSNIFALAAGRKLLAREDAMRLEVEGQAIHHSGQGKYPCPCPACSAEGYDWAEGQSYEKSRQLGHDDHYEFNLVLVLRWLKFPWDRYLNTDFAFGEGISYATRCPPIEIDQHAINHGSAYNCSRLLNYLMFEFTFALPSAPATQFFYRIHHRSGDYGLINGVSGGSNFVGAGIRYEF
ncbi:MAG: hypothetical protein KJ950_06135 [Proteobacteria bacterium]|nr:hypothetical protein [Pseudomonadota bacterium]MBU1688764.1 hypothetical protein [Pseudomonadota bacterium]